MDTDGSPKKFLKTKLVLSAFILFHFTAVVLTPHVQNYVTASSNAVLSPYINFFELGSAWSYFAPDPGPPPIFVTWESYDAHGNQVDTGRWPDLSYHPLLTERQVRRISMIRFAATDDARLIRMMMPYICSRSDKAKTVRVIRQIYPTVLIQDVAEGRRSPSDEKVVDSHVAGLELCEGKSGV